MKASKDRHGSGVVKVQAGEQGYRHKHLSQRELNGRDSYNALITRTSCSVSQWATNKMYHRCKISSVHDKSWSCAQQNANWLDSLVSLPARRSGQKNHAAFAPCSWARIQQGIPQNSGHWRGRSCHLSLSTSETFWALGRIWIRKGVQTGSNPSSLPPAWTYTLPGTSFLLCLHGMWCHVSNIRNR